MSEMRRPMARWLVVVLAVAAMAGLGWYMGSRFGGDAASPEWEAREAEGGVYPDVAGRVVRVAREEGVFTVDHEEIEGFMPAMVMDLEVAEPQELHGLEPEDEILFDLARIGGSFQAVRIREREGEASGDRATQADQADEPTVEPLGRGDRVPELVLFDAEGERFGLREMEPRHKLITFFYARCPLETFCPAQSRRLAELQAYIEESGKDLHLVSLTLDAEHDGPGVLAGYAERFEASVEHWTLAGGEDPAAVRAFADRAGAQIQMREDSYEIDHALIALRVDGDRIVDVVQGLDAIERMVREM